MKHTAKLTKHELTWNMMYQIWELSGRIEADGEELGFYCPLTSRVMLLDLCEENQQLKELLKECLNDVNHIISKVHLCKELLDLKNKIDNAIGVKQ